MVDIQGLVDRTVKWASSPEGLDALEEGRKKTEETLANLKKEREIPEEILRMPLCPKSY